MGCQQDKINPVDSSKDNDLQKVEHFEEPHTACNANPSEQQTAQEHTESEDALAMVTGTTTTVVYRTKIIHGSANNIDMSDLSEDSSMTILSDRSPRSHSFVSSAENSEVRAHGQYAVEQFISARPNNLANQESTHHANWSEQDESYSLRDSIISTASADSEASEVNPRQGARARHAYPKNLHAKQHGYDNESSSESDGLDLQHVTDTNSATIDVQVMTERLVSNLRSTSTKLSNLDYHSRGVLSETTSESDVQEL